MNDQAFNLLISCLLAFFLAFVGIICLQKAGWAQQEPAIEVPEVGHTHEGRTGEFYMTWRMPSERNARGERIRSCCNKSDCSAIVEMRRTNRTNFSYEVRVGLDVQNGVYKWWLVPDGAWEDATPDPRESPDGRGHACVYAGNVVCAVRASDQ